MAVCTVLVLLIPFRNEIKTEESFLRFIAVRLELYISHNTKFPLLFLLLFNFCTYLCLSPFFFVYLFQRDSHNRIVSNSSSIIPLLLDSRKCWHICFIPKSFVFLSYSVWFRRTFAKSIAIFFFFIVISLFLPLFVLYCLLCCYCYDQLPNNFCHVISSAFGVQFWTGRRPTVRPLTRQTSSEW